MSPRHAPAAVAPLRLRMMPAPNAVRPTLARLRRWLGGHGVDAAGQDRCELVLAELLNNVLEHACPACGGAAIGAAPVRVVASLGATRLCLMLSDPGQPLPGLRLPGARLPALDVPRTALPEGGFGWPLVHRLARAPHYRRRAGRNRLTLVLPLSPNAPLAIGKRGGAP